MDKDTKFAILAIGIPFIGLAYCALIILTMIYFPPVRVHPITTAAIFVITPSLISGSVWLVSSWKAKEKERLGL